MKNISTANFSTAFAMLIVLFCSTQLAVSEEEDEPFVSHRNEQCHTTLSHCTTIPPCHDAGASCRHCTGTSLFDLECKMDVGTCKDFGLVTDDNGCGLLQEAYCQPDGKDENGDPIYICVVYAILETECARFYCENG